MTIQWMSKYKNNHGPVKDTIEMTERTFGRSFVVLSTCKKTRIFDIARIRLIIASVVLRLSRKMMWGFESFSLVILVRTTDPKLCRRKLMICKENTAICKTITIAYFRRTNFSYTRCLFSCPLIQLFNRLPLCFVFRCTEILKDKVNLKCYFHGLSFLLVKKAPFNNYLNFLPKLDPQT